MKKVIEEKLALRIATAILLNNGEISIKDINSLPFLSRDFDVSIIVNSLIKFFDAELICRKISSEPFLQWEEVITLRTSSHLTA